MYCILVNYQTGDSSDNYDEKRYIELSYSSGVLKWSNIDIAKENLKRIEEHYRWVQSYSNRYSKNRLPVPDFVKKGKKDIIRTWTRGAGKNKTEYHAITSEYEYYIPLKLDDGTEAKINTFWIGYFEALQGASIENTKNDGWSFRL